MDSAATILPIIMALLLIGSGAGTLLKAQAVVENITSVGWPEERLWVLGVIKLAGAAGLLIGLAATPVGIAAAIGVTVYLFLAFAAHLRAKYYAVGPVSMYLAVAIATTVVLIANA